MVHLGEHIIDPETGLCEICDKGAIEKVQRGKRPVKQVFYSNDDDEYMYPPHIDEVMDSKDRIVYELDEEPSPRYVRRSVYPAPTVRPRRVIYDQPSKEPVIVRRKVVRRVRTPHEEVVVHRPKTLYYVDEENQMTPQETAPPSQPRRYNIPTKPSLPTRAVRVVRRKIQTPPPPSSERWHRESRRQIKSDTEYVERQQRIRRDETQFPPKAATKPTMYHIDAPLSRARHSPVEALIYSSRETDVSAPPVVYQGNRNRKPGRVEPVERRSNNPPEPVTVRRVYKKLPPGRHEPPEQENIRNGNHPRSVRRPAPDPRPPVKLQRTPPEFSTRNPRAAKRPNVFYLADAGEYE